MGRTLAQKFALAKSQAEYSFSGWLTMLAIMLLWIVPCDENPIQGRLFR